jgi:hypothetical protein
MSRVSSPPNAGGRAVLAQFGIIGSGRQTELEVLGLAELQ